MGVSTDASAQMLNQRNCAVLPTATHLTRLRRLALDFEFGVPDARAALLDAMPASATGVGMTFASVRAALSEMFTSPNATADARAAARRDTVELFGVLLSLLVRAVASVAATCAISENEAADLVSVSAIAMAAQHFVTPHSGDQTHPLLQKIVNPMYVPSMELTAPSASARLLRGSVVASLWGVAAQCTTSARPTAFGTSGNGPSDADVIMALIRTVLSFAETLLCGDMAERATADAATAPLLPPDAIVFLAYCASLPLASIPDAGNASPTASNRIPNSQEQQGPLCSLALLRILRRGAKSHLTSVAAALAHAATAAAPTPPHFAAGDFDSNFQWTTAAFGALVAAVGVCRTVDDALSMDAGGQRVKGVISGSPLMHDPHANAAVVSYMNAATALLVSCAVRSISDSAASAALAAAVLAGVGGVDDGNGRAGSYQVLGADTLPPISLSLSDAIRSQTEFVVMRVQQSLPYDDSIDDPSTTTTTAAAGEVLRAVLSGCLAAFGVATNAAVDVPVLGLHVAATAIGCHACVIARPHAWRHDFFRIVSARNEGADGFGSATKVCPPPAGCDEVLTLACRIIDAVALAPRRPADAPQFGLDRNNGSATSFKAANESSSPLRFGLHTQAPMAKEAPRRATDGWDDDDEEYEHDGNFGSPDLDSNTAAFVSRETTQQRFSSAPPAPASVVPFVSEDMLGLLLPDSLVATTDAIFPRVHPEQIESTITATLGDLLSGAAAVSPNAVTEAVKVLLATFCPVDTTANGDSVPLSVNTSELLNSVVVARHRGDHELSASNTGPTTTEVGECEQVESIRLQQIVLRVALAITHAASASASDLLHPCADIVAKLLFAVDIEKALSGFYYGFDLALPQSPPPQSHPASHPPGRIHASDTADDVAVVALPTDVAAAVASQQVFQFVLGLEGRIQGSSRNRSDDSDDESGDDDDWGDEDEDHATQGSGNETKIWWRALVWDVNRAAYPLLSNAIAADSLIRSMALMVHTAGRKVEDAVCALSKVAGTVMTRYTYRLLLSKRRVSRTDTAARAATSFLVALATELTALCEAVMMNARATASGSRMSEQELDTALAAWAVTSLVEPLVQLAIAAGSRRGGASGRSLLARRLEGAEATDALILHALVVEVLRPLVLRGIPARLSYGAGVASLLSATAAAWLEAHARADAARDPEPGAAVTIGELPSWWTRCAFDDHEDAARAIEAEGGNDEHGSGQTDEDDGSSYQDDGDRDDQRHTTAASTATIPAVRSWICGLLRVEGFNVAEKASGPHLLQNDATGQEEASAVSSAAASPTLTLNATARQEQAALLRAERAERDVIAAEFFHRVDVSALVSTHTPTDRPAAVVSSYAALRLDCWTEAALIAHRAVIRDATYGPPVKPNAARILGAASLLPLLAEAAVTRYAIAVEADAARAPLVAQAEALLGAAWVMAEERAVRVEAVEAEELEARMALEEICAGYVAGGMRGLALVAREELTRAVRSTETAAVTTFMYDWSRTAHVILLAEAAARKATDIYRGFDWQEKMARSLETTAEAHEWAELLEDAEMEARRAATHTAMSKTPAAVSAPPAVPVIAAGASSAAPVRPQLVPPPPTPAAVAAPPPTAAPPSGWSWEEGEEEEEEEATSISDNEVRPTPAAGTAAVAVATTAAPSQPPVVAPVAAPPAAPTALGKSAAPTTQSATATAHGQTGGWEWDSDGEEEEEEDSTTDDEVAEVVVAPTPPPPPVRSAPVVPVVVSVVPTAGNVATATPPPPPPPTPPVAAPRPLVRTAPVRPPPVAVVQHAQAPTGRTPIPTPPPTPQLPLSAGPVGMAATSATGQRLVPQLPVVPAVPSVPRASVVPAAPPVPAVPTLPATHAIPVKVTLTSPALLRKAADLAEEEVDARDEFESEESYALQRLRASADAERARLRRRVV